MQSPALTALNTRVYVPEAVSTCFFPLLAYTDQLFSP